MSSEHIVRSFDAELKSLTKTIAQMGGMAESQLDQAIQAVVRRDSQLATQVMQDDRRLDRLEQQIDVDAVTMLARRQPMASDLREIVAALKIASDLERIGDYAANVAKRAIALNQVPPVSPVTGLPRMGRLAYEIIAQVLDAYVERNVEAALEAWSRDEELDDLYTSLFRETLTYMMEDPRNITPCTHFLFIAKNIERAGDHATNIAETIHFLVRGETIRESRPKGDSSSFTVVLPPGEQDDADRSEPQRT